MKAVSAKKRFFNFILDYYVFPVISLIFFALLNETGLINEEMIVIMWLISLFQILILEFLLGQSFGKWITGTIVIRTEGGKPSLTQIIVRNIARFIPLEILSFLHANPIGWHDSLSRTLVINKEQDNSVSSKRFIVSNLIVVLVILVAIVIFSLFSSNNSQVDQESQQVQAEEKFELILPTNWKESPSSGENIIYTATDQESLFTVHKRDYSLDIEFNNLEPDEKKEYGDLIIQSVKDKSKSFELIDSGFKKTSAYSDVFFLVNNQILGEHEVVNMVYQLIDGDLYTLTMITPSASFDKKRDVLEGIMDSFHLKNK